VTVAARPARRVLTLAARGVGPLIAVVAALWGGLVAALPTRLSFAAVLGAAAVLAAVLTDAWLTLYVAAYPLQGVSLFGVQAFGFRLSHVFFLVLLAAIGWRAFGAARLALPRVGLLDALVVTFVAYTIASIAWSPAPPSVSMVSGGKLAFDVVVFLTLSALVQRDPEGTLRRVAWGFAIAFLYMAGMAAYNLARLGFRGLVASIVLEQAVTGTSALGGLSGALGSLTGTAGRNIIASWMVLGLMVVWGTVSGRWRGLPARERAVWALAVAGCAGYIVLSLSRTTWLSLVVGAAILWWRAGHQIRARVAVWTVMGMGAVAAGVVASGLAGAVAARAAAAGSVLDLGVSTRLETWRLLLTRFAESPVVGVGIKGTEALTRTISSDAGNPHNVYVQILAELGLVGALLFGALVACVLWRLWRAGNVLPAPHRRLAWGVVVAICCYLVQGLTQAEFMDLGIWTLLGLAAGLLQLQAHRSPGEAAPSRPALGGAG